MPSGPVGGWVPPEHHEQAGDVEVLPERSWAPRPDHPDDPDDPDAPALGQPPAAGAAAPAASRPGLLPATLAGGRLDPGHRGAVALLLVCLLAAVVAAGVVWRGRPQEVEVPALEQAGTALPGVAEPVPVPLPVPAPAEPAELVVAVAGEVVRPGLVRLPPGSRVDDALQAAGGLVPGGSSGLLNLARPLADGEQVVVGPDAPADSGPVAGGAAGPGGTSPGLVRLNAAGAAELEELPGIGPVLAERIVEWRTERGPFASVEQLREVPGIGEAKYAALKAKVSL